MKRERMTEAEVREAVRAQGVFSMGIIAAIVFETDGRLAVMTAPAGSGASALQGVRGVPGRSSP